MRGSIGGGAADYLSRVCEREPLRMLEATGFSEDASDEELVQYFSAFGSCSEVNVYEEFTSEQIQRPTASRPYLFLVAKMGTHADTLKVLETYQHVFVSPHTAHMAVKRYLPERLLDHDNAYVPNGVKVAGGVEGTSEGLDHLERYIQQIPGIVPTSVMLQEDDDSGKLQYIIYTKTHEMAERLLLLDNLNYPHGSRDVIKLLPLRRSSSTRAHPYAMQSAKPEPKPADGRGNAAGAPTAATAAAAATAGRVEDTCVKRLRRGYEEGYRNTMDKIQQVVDKYLATNPASVPDHRKMQDAVAKMRARPVPETPSSVKCTSCK